MKYGRTSYNTCKFTITKLQINAFAVVLFVRSTIMYECFKDQFIDIVHLVINDILLFVKKKNEWILWQSMLANHHR